MNKPVISCAFDSGRIEVLKADAADDIQLNIDKDSHSDFRQWFHFSVQGICDQRCEIRLMNASETSYPTGWTDYNICASYDREHWFRLPATFDGRVLSTSFTADQDRIYLAYFTPYSHDRHLSLLARAQQSDWVQLRTLGQTLDGRDFDMLVIGDQGLLDKQGGKRIWVIARQHPGETMAEWFIEGMLSALLDEDNPISRKLLSQSVFHVIPNMNVDGSARGNLRTNASGANLNREWMEPSMEKSPEVFLARQAMHETGVDLFLDIHGDEELPYNFVSGCEGNPNYNVRLAKLEETFKSAWAAVSPDFQDVHGYDKDAPGEGDLRIATNYVGQHFDTLAYTVEMPFKDNHNLPDPDFGWSSERCMKFGEDVLVAIHNTLPALDE